AGWSLKGNVENLRVNDYRRLWETNVFGVLSTIYATLDDLKKTQGRLVIISSLTLPVLEERGFLLQRANLLNQTGVRKSRG
ncbi:MAG: hypothetical protein F6K50_35185, partial [Moorea sp. SIO3I7]|nr:hypothetical protein [Moorena sp. SIO3I7]